MDKTHSLQALLDNTATEEDIALLKRLLVSGDNPRITTTNTRIRVGAHLLRRGRLGFEYLWQVLFVDGIVSGGVSQLAD